MNKTIRNLAIAALFIFPGISGFPQEVQQTAAPAAPVSAQAAGIAEANARNFKVELDSEGVLMLYEVEFDSGFHEYEYKIDARTGAIVGTKKKLDIF